MPDIPNITNITPPRVPLTDQRTGLISREWYRFFLSLFTLTGGGSNTASLTDLQVGPPVQPIDLTTVDPYPALLAAYAMSQAQESQIAELQKQVQAVAVTPPFSISGEALTKVNDTNVTLTLGGNPTTALLNPTSLTLGWTGQLGIGRGGTGVSTTPTNGQLLIGNGTGYAVANLTAGTNISITNTAGGISIASSNPGGTVTSVGLSMPSQFTVTNSPVTSSGTLTAAWNNQTANYVFAGPTTGASAAPTFRALVSSDIPSLSYVSSVSATAPITSTGGLTPTIGVTSAALTKTDDTNVTLTLGGSPSTALLAATSLTLGWAGQLATTRGGTGLSSFSANGILYASSTSALATDSNFVYNGTNVGLGGAASTRSLGRAIELYAQGSAIWGYVNSLVTTQNVLYNGSFTYASTAPASYYAQISGVHTWAVAASGTAGTGISFNAAMSLDLLGNLNLAGLTASKVVFTDASKNLTSTGTVGISQGGTGVTSTPSNGQLLIGNGSGFTLSTLSAGSGVSISNSAGGISISATGSGGTVTSVGMTVPAFLSVSGSPITSSGTLAVSLSGTALPTANGGTNVTSAGTSGSMLISNGTNWTANTVPAFNAYNNAAQTISASTLTKIAFNATDFDTASYFDTANNRYKPLVAGYYNFQACVVLNTGLTACVMILTKNGSIYKYLGGGLSTGSYNSMGGGTTVYANGSTDYFEIAIYQWTGTGVNTTSGSSNCWFSGCLVRGA
jgi:hypothetical protein